MNEIKGRVFNIERYAIEDGPGIRTVVFLKGCSLRCEWCANPESQRMEADILYFQKKCGGCQKCLLGCTQNAIEHNPQYGFVTNANKCILCEKCVDECFYGARELFGKVMETDELFEKIMDDKRFYEESGGGVTFSGGEPFLQGDFLQAVLKRCCENTISTAIESCGFVQWGNIEKSLPYLDLIYFDIKHLDPQKHQLHTGQSNDRILANLNKIDAYGKKIIIRTPFIPGINGDTESIQKIMEYVSKLKSVDHMEILPYHRLGNMKYQALGRKYGLEELEPVKKTDLGRFVELGEKIGVKVSIGSKT